MTKFENQKNVFGFRIFLISDLFNPSWEIVHDRLYHTNYYAKQQTIRSGKKPY